VDIESLFRSLSAEHVVDIFLALLAEKKVLLISKSKALLTHACVAFLSFLFPFSWKHVLIPILPRSMIDVLDAPVPFLIGADPSIFSSSNPLSDDLLETGYEDTYASVEIPQEVYRVNLDMGLMVEDKKMKHKAVAQLKARLKKATDHFERPDPQLHMIDQAFNVVSYQEDEDGNEADGGRPVRFNEYEVRDAFLEFMQTIMSNYTLHLVTHHFY
jgi:DENN domain-containing protein 5